jgi:cell division protein FtsI (penicillin-binding protein 3)
MGKFYLIKHSALNLSAVAKIVIGILYTSSLNQINMKIKTLLSLLIFICFISCNKSELEISKKLENKLVTDAYAKRPLKDKEYIVTTNIDTATQHVATVELLKCVKQYNADYGTVILMETSTGKIRSMVNLEKNNSGEYITGVNNAIYGKLEPASFIKPFDLMALLEDNKADTSSVYSSHNGEIRYYGKLIRDSHKGGYGDISLGKALIYSSNTIFAQAIDQVYSKKPIEFTSKFKKYQLGVNLDLPFTSTSKSIIPQPNSRYWSSISLPWMGFGYGLMLSPIEILTYYNAIANNGEAVKPLFVNEIKNNLGQNKRYEKKVLKSKICSDTTTFKIQDLLRKVVTSGTGSNAKSDKIQISGKTASIQINYGKEGSRAQFASGFAGYFPSNKPKYSIIVIISNPIVDKLNYGVDLAGIVVREIGENVK